MFFHLFYVFIWLVVWGQQNILFVQIDILIKLEIQKYGRYEIICLKDSIHYNNIFKCWRICYNCEIGSRSYLDVVVQNPNVVWQLGSS